MFCLSQIATQTPGGEVVYQRELSDHEPDHGEEKSALVVGQLDNGTYAIQLHEFGALDCRIWDFDVREFAGDSEALIIVLGCAFVCLGANPNGFADVERNC